VNTVSKALDDLFHFVLLFVVVYITFCLIGVTTFGQQNTDFADYASGFARLFDLMVRDRPWLATGQLTVL
jgi:hypothetical protein